MNMPTNLISTTEIIKYLAIGIIFAVNSYCCEALGRGYQSSEKTELESPIEVLGIAYGPQNAILVSVTQFHSEDKTNHVMVNPSIGIGTAVLGAEIVGSGGIKNDNSYFYFSTEYFQEWSQDVEIKNWQRSPFLNEHKWRFSNVNFKKRFGDEILWSARIGGSIKVTILARAKKKNSVTKMNLEAQLKLLFSNITVGRLSYSKEELTENFDFLLFVEQKGGIENEVMNRLENLKDGNWSSFFKLRQAYNIIYTYCQKDFTDSTRKHPFFFRKNFVAYSEYPARAITL